MCHPRISLTTALLAVLCASGAAAQSPSPGDDAVQRALLERQQQSDAFSLQLQQSQQRLSAPPAQLPALEARQLHERQALDNTNAAQVNELQSLQAAQQAAPVGATAWGPRLQAAPQRMQQERDVR